MLGGETGEYEMGADEMAAIDRAGAGAPDAISPRFRMLPRRRPFRGAAFRSAISTGTIVLISGDTDVAIANIEIPRDGLEEFWRRYKIRRLALFGSVLRGDFDSQSDVDMLVQFQPHARIGFLRLSRIRRELSDLLKRPVDLVPQDGLKPLIRDAILSSAKEIYAA